MAPYYGPDEDAATIMLERMFVAGDFISGVGYGLKLAIRSSRSRQSIFLLVYITTLLLVETVFEIAQAHTVQMIYVDNRNYPGGPWAYFLATQNLPINVVFIASLFTLTFLADMLVLWRCWVIWRAFGSVLPVAYGTSYYAISLGVNIVLTLLITTRLLLYRRTMMQTMPGTDATEYVSLLAIIIESASLYSVFALIFLVTYAINAPVNSVFLTVASFCQQIANYLIIYRVAQGRAWHHNTVAQTATAIEFNGRKDIYTSQDTGRSTFNDETHPAPIGKVQKESELEKPLAENQRPMTSVGPYVNDDAYIGEVGPRSIFLTRNNATAYNFMRIIGTLNPLYVVLAGLGGLSRWSWPDIPGFESFKGQVIHSAEWEKNACGWEETVKSWGDKRVAVIGVGSSAIQMVAALQPRVKHLSNYVRGKTWISATFVRDRLDKLAKGKPVSNYYFTEEDRKNFEDPEFYKNFRWDVESEMNAANSSTLLGTEMQMGAQAAFRDDMLKRLARKPWIADHLIPDFAPACRRLTPGPGYLEALCEDNVDFVPTPIARITPTGIETDDGNHQDIDVLICFDTSFRFGFPIIGRNGLDLSTKYDPYPQTYLSVATDGFPNWFQCLGPNAAVGAGSLLLVMEKQVDYIVAATLKLQRERLKSIEVKAEAVADYDAYLESYFPQTVFAAKCRSWYKGGKAVGRVTALWPGSCLHAARALAHPRWEDYNYEPLDGPIKNRLYWLGDGQTVADKDPHGDKAWYLKEIDYPPVNA
ncbi:hypothetical protein H0H93_013515 [Arthromyces matolae]|nr:hypothetical protein H0H93_013515 [Arthromyces matolae]